MDLNSANKTSSADGGEDAADFDQRRLQRAFDLCVRKARRNIQRLADEPKSGAWAVDGDYFSRQEAFYHIDNWTSSFFTGMALLAWEQTGDEFFLRQVRRLASHYIAKVFTRHCDTMHDLGFLYSLYSVALHKLTDDKVHRETGLRAAEMLARRFNPTGNFIRAWGRMDTGEHENMAIIDCMMNLPLLYWATEQTRQARFRDVAVRHADTVLKHFIRADDSIYHAYLFDMETGAPVGGANYGGCEVESHWARGAAWGIYGYALSHRHTGDAKYLTVSFRLARKFIAHLDDEVIPLWDFKPVCGTPRIRDASAASVAVCGLQELLRFRPGDALLAGAKERLLNRLCSDDYVDFRESCPGVQRNGQVGNGKPGGAQNAYTSWGDYFLMEALSRELFKHDTWW